MAEPLTDQAGFFVIPNSATVESMTDSNLLMATNPEVYGPRFEAIADLRKLDDGSLHKGNGFRRVASFVNIPLFRAMSTVLEPGFMRDKKRFYKWLDTGDNFRYCTYDRRKQKLPNQLTFVDGKAVI